MGVTRLPDKPDQLYRIMRLTTFILLIGCVHVSANVLSQTVTLHVEKQPLTTIFEQIEQQTGFQVVYNDRFVSATKPLSIRAVRMPLNEFLEKILKPESLSFQIMERTVFIQELEEHPLTNSMLPIQALQQRKITGQVMDSDGQPLADVTVRVAGADVMTTTNSIGMYELSIPVDRTTLLFSIIGYETLERILTNETVLNVTLQTSISNLDEVVVVGYGTQSRGMLTGAVSSVNSEKLTVAPVASTTNTLFGLIPGLILKQSQGLPGSDGASLNIRGYGGPLIIVDGIETGFNNIDANQIASITVLKDGAASIYGARAGNGVILVTTKRGSIQKPTINLNSSYSLQGVTSILKPSNAGQRAQLEREGHLNAGLPEANVPWTAEEVEKFFSGEDPAYQNYDWYEYVFRDWAPQQNHNLSINGGTDKLKFFGFLGYTDQETMIKRNGGGYQRYNVQSNIDSDISDNLSLHVDLALSHEDRHLPVRGLGQGGYLWQEYYNTRPWFPTHFPDETKVPWGGLDVGSIASVSNIDLMGYDRNKALDLRGSIALDYKFRFLEGLSAKAFLNYRNGQGYNKRFAKPIDFYSYNVNTEEYTKVASFSESNLGESYNRNHMLTQQYSVSFNRIFEGKHHVSALALVESIETGNNSFSATRTNLLTPEIDQLFVGSTTGMGNNGSASEMGRKSFVSRVNYAFLQKYLVEGIFRADASAKFPSNSRWGYFPGVSLAWVASEESFFSSATALDQLKLRVSYGESGNDGVSNFAYLAGYGLRGGVALLDNNVVSGLYVTGLPNPILTWETITTYNAGLDFSIWKNALYGTFDVFYRERSGIPASRINSLPSTFGSSLPPENLNSLANRGFDFSLGSNRSLGDFTYDLSANISWSAAKWIHFEEPDYEDPDQERLYKRSGTWTDRAIGYVYEKLFTSMEEVEGLEGYDNSVLKPGDIKYKDLNGDGVLDWKDQQQIGNSTTPRWMYGINGMFSYRNFQLTALLQGAFGYNTTVNLTTYPNAAVYDLRWTPETNDPHALIPRMGGAPSNSYTSDYRFVATSYLRLKTASLGYQLPSAFIQRYGLQSLRVFVSGANLLTFSTLNKYGIDPESPGTIMYYPQQRTISFGLNLGL